MQRKTLASGTFHFQKFKIGRDDFSSGLAQLFACNFLHTDEFNFFIHPTFGMVNVKNFFGQYFAENFISEKLDLEIKSEKLEQTNWTTKVNMLRGCS